MVRYPAVQRDIEVIEDQPEVIALLFFAYRSSERDLGTLWKARNAPGKTVPRRDPEARREQAARRAGEMQRLRREFEDLHKATDAPLREIPFTSPDGPTETAIASVARSA